MNPDSKSLIIPVVLVSFAATASTVPADTWLTTAAFSLAAGVTAVALMAIAAVLGSRWRWIDFVFGGLDRAYEVHKWLGVWALAFATFHLVFGAELDTWQTSAILSLPRPAVRLMRQLSFVVLMLTVLLALNRRIPYSRWRWWHKLSGPLFLIVIVHWLSFKSPIALASAPGIWLAALSALGVIAALYKLVLYPVLSQHADYRLQSVSTSGSAIHLQLSPEGRGIPFQPGQFAFLSFELPGLREPHPFTIASAAHGDGSIAFIVRAAGDYTERLMRNAKPGLIARVYAPFGRFRRSVDADAEIWIAGGVGVTPFVAWLRDPHATALERVTFFHFHTPGRELPTGVNLTALAHARGVEIMPVTDGPTSSEFRQRFMELITRHGASEIRINFCGPEGLLRELRRLMHETGVPEDRLRHELFQFR